MCCRRGCIGIEGDISFPNFLDDGIVSARTTPSSAVTEKLDFISTVRGRVGYAFSHWLFYATGGFAWSQARFLEDSNLTGSEDKILRAREGWALGAGAEFAIAGLDCETGVSLRSLRESQWFIPIGYRLRIGDSGAQCTPHWAQPEA
jgi:hypothetical protein